MARIIGFSDGSDGDLSITTTANLTTVYNYCYGNQGDYVLNVPSGTGSYDVGDKILIMQMQTGNVGSHEMNFITGKTATTLQLLFPLEVNYTSVYISYWPYNHYSGAQVIKLNQYGTVQVGSGGVITCDNWRGGIPGYAGDTRPVGGIASFMVNKLVLTGDGAISADGKGYWGGTHTPWKWGISGESINSVGIAGNNAINDGGGGGGGNGASDAGSGGGGGSYGSSGQQCGCFFGCKNQPLPGNVIGGPTLKNDFYLGSGGGCALADLSSWGGEGGGGIFIIANEIDISGGYIRSNGIYRQTSPQATYFTGGGGSGGAVKIVCQTAKLGINRAQAIGGTKGNPVSDNGGNGGLGRFRLECCDYDGSIGNGLFGSVSIEANQEWCQAPHAGIC